MKAKVLTFAIVILAIGILAWLMNITPTGLVPDEDTGTIMAAISMPPATSQERTQVEIDSLDAVLKQIPAIKTRVVIQGYNFIAGQGNAYGSAIIKLKDWKDRGKGESSSDIIKQLYAMTAMKIKDGQIMYFAPPMISGYSVTNGFEVQLQDKTGGDLNKFFQIMMQFVGALNQRPEIQMAYSTFNPAFPQYMIDIDVAKTKKAGIGPSTILTTLQGYYGGMYISNFNDFGKLYRVMMQAAPESRVSP
jgi:HAE1 family hydrophobic/amphiphilic exporter-1